MIESLRQQQFNLLITRAAGATQPYSQRIGRLERRRESMSIKKSYVIALAVITASCANPSVWSKPGATQQEFALTSFQCKNYMQQSAGMYGNDPLVGMMVLGQDLIKECLVAHGWQQVAQ